MELQLAVMMPGCGASDAGVSSFLSPHALLPRLGRPTRLPDLTASSPPLDTSPPAPRLNPARSSAFETMADTKPDRKPDTKPALHKADAKSLLDSRGLYEGATFHGVNPLLLIEKIIR